MKDSTLEDVVIATALLTGWAAVTIARALLVPLLALVLTVAGWRPAPALTPEASTAPAAPDPLALAPALPAAPLASLKVMELRRMARLRGLKTLGRTGRRADLLEALTPA
jgi:hypothetical protein